MAWSSLRRGQLAGLAAAVLFGISAPLISTVTGSGSALSIAGLLYGGATLALLTVRLFRDTEAETSVGRQDWPALAALTLLGGVVGPVALVMGLARLPAASSSLLLNLEAVFTLAIAVLLGREHLGRRGLLSAGLTIAAAVLLSEGSLSGANAGGSALIALATLAWGIDNNLSQSLSLRNPIQIATCKAAGASLPMLALALLLGHPFPALPVMLALLAIGALGYGISIWLDLLALRDLGAAREAVLFSTAPFVGALFSLVILREAFTPQLLVAAGLMAAGVLLLLLEQHSHWHRHDVLRHAHRHRHDPLGGDPHHEHRHQPEELEGVAADQPFWHAHEHCHGELEHAHPHVSDTHHRHRH
ncbi:DMT family transporter [Cyanobium sp. NS01]|uniref:DMT family transporter n=1 Tax=Cyanobium sp. NS01 TaxID=261284 RepID=UPI001645FB12|nr:DMT family transporter [Cyanobium sp. NS01]QNI70933.1 drug/metabolite transporter (DMT) superfamily efflux protein [Cyanobium sp. NS01]